MISKQMEVGMRPDSAQESASQDADSVVEIVLVSGTCCNPNFKALDNQALRVIEQAAAETAVEIHVETTTLTAAYYAAPREVSQRLAGDFAAGRIGVPAILIGGEAVSYGVPSIDDVKAALLRATKTREGANE